MFNLNHLCAPKTHRLRNILEGEPFPYVKAIEGSKGYKNPHLQGIDIFHSCAYHENSKDEGWYVYRNSHGVSHKCISSLLT